MTIAADGVTARESMVPRTLRHRLARPATAWTLLAISITTYAAFATLFYTPITPTSFYANGNNLAGLWTLPVICFPIVGVVIATRRPANPIGWICLVAGAVLGTATLAAVVGSLLLHAHVAAGGWVLLLDAPNATSVSVGAGAIALVVLLFPDGTLLTPRWRWAVAAVLATMAVGLAFDIVNPAPGNLGLSGSDVSPLATTALAPAEIATTAALNSVMGLIFVVALVSLFLRRRNADSDRRHQLRWVAYAGVATALVLFGFQLVPIPSDAPAGVTTVITFIFALSISSIPVAIGIAVLKYRLYDIDLIISRTLVYGSLAVFITAVYVAIAVGIGAAVGGGGKPNLALSIVATAIVAVGFQPVRDRVQRVANRLVYGTRATPYEVLAQFSERVAESYAADDVLPRMARVLADGSGAQRASVWLRTDGHWVEGAVWPSGAAVAARSAAADGDRPPAAADERVIPVRHQGDLLGALSIVKRTGEALTPVEEKLVNDLAAQAGLVLRNVGLSAELHARIDDLRASRQRLVGAQDAERRRLERNLHDGAQQHLVALKVKLGLAEMLMTRDPAKAVTTLAQLKGDADEALETLRDLARGIYPPLLADKGLAVALESQARKSTVPVDVDAEEIGRYPQEIESAVYFCCLEAMQNMQKYAHATHASIRLHHSDGELLCKIEDDGDGFDVAAASKGAGLSNMVDRFDALGGTMQVTSAPGKGTRIIGTLPAVALSEQPAFASP